MAQNVSGLRSIFSNAWVYNLAQRLVGAEKARSILVSDYMPQQQNLRILDIGCGTAEILRHLPADTDYFGFDASPTYIAQAQEQFGERGTFRAELVREATLNEMKAFDIVLAFGILHHLDDDEAIALFKLASMALTPSGKLITIDPTYEPAQSSLARWIISKDRGQNIRTPEHYSQLAKTHFKNVSEQVESDMLHIPYSHCILECKNSDI